MTRSPAASFSMNRIPRPFVSTAFAFVALGASMTVCIPSMANAAEIVRTGTFAGQSDHVVTGKVTIEQDGDRTIVVLHEDFTLDGAPAPTVGFSEGGKFDTATEFAKLESPKGEQRYEVPKTIVASAYDAFTVWCSKFSIPLGSAKLK